MANPKVLYLLDGHALIYQYHFALRDRPLINSKGLNTSALVGFTRMLWDLLQNSKPSHIAVVFDPEGPTFRSELFAEYKANREEQPQDIATALPLARDIVRGFNIPVVIADGYEADDVIGTLAKQAEREGFEVFMVTPDKDYGQLVSDHIHQYRPSRMGSGVTILQKQDILDKWDIERPEQVIDVLALMGDSSDNIPGVSGIGPKTAAKLLKEFGSLENILARKEEIRGKNSERLTEQEDSARLSYQLATINTEAPVRFDATSFTHDPLNAEKLSALFAELEIRSLAKKILGDSKSPTTGASTGGTLDLFSSNPNAAAGKPDPAAGLSRYDAERQRYVLVDSEDLLRELLEKLRRAEVICFDTETTNLDPNEAELVGIAFSVAEQEGYYVPIAADRDEAIRSLEPFRALLEDETVPKVAQNFKYDAIVLKWYGIDMRGQVEDTMLMHYLLSPELKHNLTYLSETYLNYAPQPIEELIGKKGKNQKTMREVPVADAALYAAEDTDLTLRLYHLLRPKLVAEQMIDLYNRVEAPLVYVLRDMEYNGVALDTDFLSAYSEELKEKQLALQEKIFEETGQEFNIGSPKQVGEILFDVLEIPYKGRKTKTGQYRTDEFTMQEAAKQNPVARQILEYRQLSKLRGTYVDALPKLINPRDGRVHSSFNQAAVATGRLSSSNPNLQNIPMRTEVGRQIRRAFVPRVAGNKIVSADYSQIELRLIAEVAGEQNMLAAFNEGRDIHRATAAMVYGVDYDAVTPDQRRKAKTVNFGIIYGAGATRMANELEIPRREAAELIERYYAAYPDFKAYVDKQVSKARQDGYVETLLGRRRYLRDINTSNNNLRAYAERNAVNTPIQGTAADLMKLAMINVHARMRREKMKSLLILQVHDELVFDAPVDEVARLRTLVKEEMETAMPSLGVRLLVESDVGDNWLEAH